MSIFKIKGVIQNYAWGGDFYIPNLLDLQTTEEKCAEYWMGAHDKAPATLEGENFKLNELIRKDPVGLLGEKVYEKFGRLPYLFKVLDVNNILSIQVHPSKKEAEKGFALENEKGIPLSAPFRNYKDDNHKPEIMVALGDFWLLHGFKPKDELKETLGSTNELIHLLPIFEQSGYKGLYQFVMEESPEDTNRTLRPLIDRILTKYQEGKIEKSSPDFWAARAFLTFCPKGDLDKGLYSIYFFNIVNVKEGEAVFQDAGVPHAYMEGQNMELMANSDNVLRGGLTPKHVDVTELLKHVTFSETIPNILKGDLQSDGLERIYHSSAPDFELSKIDMNANSAYKTSTKTLEILIVLEGETIVKSDKESFTLARGEVFAATANTSYRIESEHAILYKAKCPL